LDHAATADFKKIKNCKAAYAHEFMGAYLKNFPILNKVPTGTLCDLVKKGKLKVDDLELGDVV
jgi:hypothetical protein